MRRSRTSRATQPIDSADCASSREYIQAALRSIDSACKAAVVLCNRDGSLTRMDVLREEIHEHCGWWRTCGTSSQLPRVAAGRLLETCRACATTVTLASSQGECRRSERSPANVFPLSNRSGKRWWRGQPGSMDRVLCTLGQRLLCTPSDLAVSRLRGRMCPFSPSAK